MARKLKFRVYGTRPDNICIPQDEGPHYLCRDGKVYNWVTGDKNAIGEIVFFHKVEDAQAVLDRYNDSFKRIRVHSKSPVVTLTTKIVKLKNMVKDLRTRYNPELLVEVYKLVENL